ncbi:MAG TPA: LPS export ABC transporter periplasmic protein LptC [Terriglobia bacterium]|nr:LPS export ABC transporter periplasmic protein LptC [Terriglobia bacterium]
MGWYSDGLTGHRGNPVLGTQSLSQQSDRRRRRFAVLVGVSLGIAVVGVAIAYWQNFAHKDKTVILPQTLPANVDQQLSGYTFTRSEGGRKIFTVHAARTVSFTEGNSTVLQDVYVEIFGPAGIRHDVLRTDQCNYDPKTQELFAAGKVNMELNDFEDEMPDAAAPVQHRPDPVFLETSKVHFTQQGTLAETDQPVSFRTSRASGTARGMKYNSRTDGLELQNDVVLKLPPRGGAKPEPEATLTASNLRYDKDKQEIDLQGPIEVTQAGSHVSGGRGTVWLQERNRLRRMLMEDHVRGFEKGQDRTTGINANRVQADFATTTSDLQKIYAEGDVEGQVWRNGRASRLAAQQVEIAFSGVHPHPLDGTASGNVKLSIDAQHGGQSSSVQPSAGGNLGSANQELTAARLKFSFRPEEQTLREAQTVGPGHIVLTPADPKTGKREIFGEPLVMNFDEHSRLQTLLGLSKARLLFHPSQQAPAGSPIQESSSDHLKATFDPAAGTLLGSDQAGNFQYRQGKQRASADRALYDGNTQLLTLTGHPQVSDPETQVHADRILMDMAKGSAQGFDHILSTHLEVAGQTGGEAKNIPTNVAADRMFARRDTQFVHYEGHVRLWHGTDVVESPSLDVYKKERRVTSVSRVMTSFIQSPTVDAQNGAPLPAPKKGPTPVTIGADRLDYSDDGRKASYRGHVILTTENTTMRSDRLDVFLTTAATAESSEVDRALADGHVTVVQPTRRSTGQHAEYLADMGKILLTGGPPTVLDQANGFTTGRSLTLFLRDDTILVNGGVKSPTLSKHSISQ